MKKRSNTKLVVMLTAFLMGFVMMPLIAFGDETTVSGLWVGDAEVTSTGPVTGTGATSGSATVSIINAGTDDETLVLELNEFNYVGEGHTYGEGSSFVTTASICYTGGLPLKINLIGENTVGQPDMSTGGYSSSGIYSNEELIITGTGSLNVSGGKSNEDSTGIYSDREITIKGCSVTATGGQGGLSCGIWCSHGLTIDESGVVNASAHEASPGSTAIKAHAVNIDNGDVTATDAKFGIKSSGLGLKKILNH